MAICGIRFDLRVPEWAPVDHAGQYRAALDMCEWADDLGLDFVALSEHHGTPDGYLPAPFALAGVIAGRTKRIGINVAAVLVPLHDPIRLAEQLAVLDLATGGRVGFVAGAGYRTEEFEMAGVDKKQRGKLLEEYVGVMLQAWTGEPFEWRGRTIVVQPTPATKPHPMLMIGGSTEVAARRAARLHLPFFPAVGDPKLAEIYNEECATQGFAGGFAALPQGPGFVHIAKDPDAAWEQIGPHALFDAQTYESWQSGPQRSAVDVKGARTWADVRASGVYQVLTPDEAVAMVQEQGDFGTMPLHPLMGGMSPELGWESLRLFASDVLPRLRG
jgi:alkanesulfonate monooxygenase SsuD/methylene tetrahydromethanopterin reductase-like flavin-dependent oxidoreductase (luciferase family)